MCLGAASPGSGPGKPDAWAGVSEAADQQLRGCRALDPLRDSGSDAATDGLLIVAIVGIWIAVYSRDKSLRLKRSEFIRAYPWPPDLFCKLRAKHSGLTQQTRQPSRELLSARQFAPWRRSRLTGWSGRVHILPVAGRDESQEGHERDRSGGWISGACLDFHPCPLSIAMCRSPRLLGSQMALRNTARSSQPDTREDSACLEVKARETGGNLPPDRRISTVGRACR